MAKTRKFLLFFVFISVALLVFFSFSKPVNKYNFETASSSQNKATVSEKPQIHEEGDIEYQKPLKNPPSEIKAIYITSTTAGNAKKIDDLINLVKKSGLNAMVIDIKDYTGYVFYDSGIEEVEKYKAEKILIPKINTLIKKLHDENIYAIARVVVFQDPRLAAARPDLAVKNRITGGIWKDHLGLAWIDPGAQDSWDYIVKISNDATKRGFDEINYDYIRFPSDGQLSVMGFSFFDKKGISKAEQINEFFVYLREKTKRAIISADLFGLTTSAADDLGIGQVIEDAYKNFDFVSPMVYPSHYAVGFLGYENPAAYPYEVVKYAIEKANEKLEKLNKAEEFIDSDNKKTYKVQVRPWIQAFNMGGVYDISKIKVQIKGSDESGGVGWMLWNPANNYYFLNSF